MTTIYQLEQTIAAQAKAIAERDHEIARLRAQLDRMAAPDAEAVRIRGVAEQIRDSGGWAALDAPEPDGAPISMPPLKPQHWLTPGDARHPDNAAYLARLERKR